MSELRPFVVGFTRDDLDRAGHRRGYLQKLGCTEFIDVHGSSFDAILRTCLGFMEIKRTSFHIFDINDFEIKLNDFIRLVSEIHAHGSSLEFVKQGFSESTEMMFVTSIRILLDFHLKRSTVRRIVGLEGARKLGLKPRRKKKLSEVDANSIYDMILTGKLDIRNAAIQYGVSRKTMQRYVAEARSRKEM